MDRLNQLLARSLREIEARSPVLGKTEAGRELLHESAVLLAGLRLWAQAQYRSDQVVKDLLERCDVHELDAVAGELRSGRTPDENVAGQDIASIVQKAPGELAVVASCAVGAL